jgi:hypothetical protein
MSIRTRPEESFGSKLFSDISLDPIRSVFDPSSPGYWQWTDPQSNPLFSVPLANPLIFLGAVLLLALGIGKRWLTAPEIGAAAFLLLIPYVSKGGALYMTYSGPRKLDHSVSY